MLRLLVRIREVRGAGAAADDTDAAEGPAASGDALVLPVQPLPAWLGDFSSSTVTAPHAAPFVLVVVAAEAADAGMDAICSSWRSSSSGELMALEQQK